MWHCWHTQLTHMDTFETSGQLQRPPMCMYLEGVGAGGGNQNTQTHRVTRSDSPGLSNLSPVGNPTHCDTASINVFILYTFWCLLYNPSSFRQAIVVSLWEQFSNVLVIHVTMRWEIQQNQLHRASNNPFHYRTTTALWCIHSTHWNYFINRDERSVVSV